MLIGSSAERAGVFFQRGPGLGSVLLAPVGIVAALLERLAKLLRFRIGKEDAFAPELRAQGGVYLWIILPLEQAGRVEIPLRNFLQILGQRGPCPAIKQEDV